MNATYSVAALYKCNEITEKIDVYQPDPMLRTTFLGCQVLELLQEMFHFQMTYVNGYRLWDPKENDSYASPPDIYAKPLNLKENTFDYAYPLQTIIDRRYGFVLRRPDNLEIRDLYSLPFAGSTWAYLNLTILIITLVLYILCQWEKHIIRPCFQEYSFTYELLVVIGACCQHIPPVNPILTSRRIAYFTFFCFFYITYSFYTSNLLSHLVNDRDKAMTLTQLVESDYQFVTLNNMQLNTSRRVHASMTQRLPKLNIFRLRKKINEMKYVDVLEGLKTIGREKVALLSDYITIYPFMRKSLNNREICDIAEIDLFSNLKEFLVTSKTFPLKEKFKIGLLRIKETGILKRIKREKAFTPPKCQCTPGTQARFLHVIVPLIILAVSIKASVIILLFERAYYKRNRVWPYTD